MSESNHQADAAAPAGLYFTRPNFQKRQSSPDASLGEGTYPFTSSLRRGASHPRERSLSPNAVGPGSPLPLNSTFPGLHSGYIPCDTPPLPVQGVDLPTRPQRKFGRYDLKLWDPAGPHANESLVIHRTRTQESEDGQEDLRIASSRNPTTLLELDLTGHIRYLGKTWESVVGTPVGPLIGKHVSEIVEGDDSDKHIFNQAIGIMTQDDTSYRVKFVTRAEAVQSSLHLLSDDVVAGSPDATIEDDTLVHGTLLLPTDANDVSSETHCGGGREAVGGQASVVSPYISETESIASLEPANLSDTASLGFIQMEGQGVLIHDPKTLLPTHSMWLLKPFQPTNVELELPFELTDYLGFGADIFASYLLTLNELGVIDASSVPPPKQVLCRICEQELPAWFIERHSELCFVEHKAEAIVQQAHDRLEEHRQLILSLSDSISLIARGVVPLEPAAYKGHPLPPATEASTLTPSNLLLHRHSEHRKRYPLKLLGILVDLCEEALAINPGELQELMEVAYSPGTEKAMKYTIGWKLFESSDPAIAALVGDTETLVQTKVSSIFRYAASLQYSEKIKRETDKLVVQAVAQTVEKIRSSTYAPRDRAASSSRERGLSPVSVHSPQPRAARVPSNSSSQSDLFGGYSDVETPLADLRNSSLADLKGLSLAERLSSPLSLRVDHKRSVTPTEVLLRGRQLRVSRSVSSEILEPKSYSPRRHLSPCPTYVSNVPLTSIQRVSRDAPVESPVLATQDVPHLDTLMGLPPLDAKPPLSPLLVSSPSVRLSAPSIRDYEIVKPISKGAFGSVFLARRRLTGDLYAIKVLKKSDMISKNQVTNIKSERAIMMAQSDSPYVAKLYATFQSSRYLFLVMEYMNGGDCGALLKVWGTLPDAWARKYVAEMIVAVSDLHAKGIIHRDIKPDNFLIDGKGHLKLTDFGLSKMGVARRQDQRRRSSAMEPPLELFQPLRLSERKLSVSKALPLSDRGSVGERPPWDTDRERTPSIPITFSLAPEAEKDSPNSAFLEPYMQTEGSRARRGSAMADGPTATLTALGSFTGEEENRLYALFNPEETAPKKFVGTPDYLSPETVKGLPLGPAVDWWSIGCILFEFLFGYPPFHADTPEGVFARILTGRLEWPLPEVVSEACLPAARDLIEKLLVLEPSQRLGSADNEDIRNHPYFEGVDWDGLWEEGREFVPRFEGEESTDYFDSRGVEQTVFPVDESDEEFALPANRTLQATGLGSPTLRSLLPLGGSPATPTSRERRGSRLNENFGEFGSFQFRNYNALDKANKDVITRLKTEHMEHHQSFSSATSDSSQRSRSRGYSFTSSPTIHHHRVNSIASTFSSGDENFSNGELSNPPTPGSPHVSLTMSIPVALGAAPGTVPGGKAVFLRPHLVSMTTGSSSVSSGSPKPVPGLARRLHQRSVAGDLSPSASDSELEFRSMALARVQQRRESNRRKESSFSSMSGDVVRPTFHKVDAVLCEPNGASRIAAERLLVRLGCNAITVGTGDSLVRKVTSEVKFDVILTSYKLPNLDTSVDIAKLIRHTATSNTNTPLICITRHVAEATESGAFDLVLEQPLTERAMINVLMRFCNWTMPLANNDEAISDSEGSGTPPTRR